jgi:hypothetical protein
MSVFRTRAIANLRVRSREEICNPFEKFHAPVHQENDDEQRQHHSRNYAEDVEPHHRAEKLPSYDAFAQPQFRGLAHISHPACSAGSSPPVYPYFSGKLVQGG